MFQAYMYLGFAEKNIIYPVMFISCATSEAPILAQKLGPLTSSLILTVCSLKCLRLSFSHTSCQYLILAFSVLFFRLECTSETFVVDYFFISIIYYKMYDLLLKVRRWNFRTRLVYTPRVHLEINVFPFILLRRFSSS